jgi:hypothetical protein
MVRLFITFDISFLSVGPAGRLGKWHWLSSIETASGSTPAPAC